MTVEPKVVCRYATSPSSVVVTDVAKLLEAVPATDTVRIITELPEVEERMRTSQPIRLYVHPLRLALFAAGWGIPTVFGVWVIHNSGGEVLLLAIGTILVVPCGCLTTLVLLELLVGSILRYPQLQIDARGWSTPARLFSEKRSAAWPDIQCIGMYQLDAGDHGRFAIRYWYYLVIHPKDPANAAQRTNYPLTIWHCPALQGAMMLVGLNPVFWRTTPEKIEDTLQQALNAYAGEIAEYGIQMSTEIQDLREPLSPR
jgi:hypothetical protein